MAAIVADEKSLTPPMTKLKFSRAVLRTSDLQETSVFIKDSTSCGLIGIKCIGGNHNEGGTRVGDSCGSAQNGRSTVVNALIDAPIITRRTRCS
jgi:hypothetical protein